MTSFLPPRAQQATTTTGTGTLTLGTVTAQCQSFEGVLGVGGVTTYMLLSGDATNWEEGIGTIGGSGPYTLTRSPLRSSNGNALISLTGTSTVFVTQASDGLDPAFPLQQSISASGSTFLGTAGVFVSSLIFPAVAGDVWRLRAAVTRGSSSTTCGLQFGDSTGANGYSFNYQTDGNLVTYAVYSGSGHVIGNSPGGSGQRSPASTVAIQATIGFNSGGYNLMSFDTYQPLPWTDNNINFLSGGTFQIGIVSDTYADIGRVVLTKLS
jgi:hypothetical protein